MLISNNEIINFYIDYDDGTQQNLTMCDNYLILNHIYTKTGIFNITVISLDDDLYQDLNLISNYI